MSFVAGVFIMNMPEEDAFWCILALFDGAKYFEGFYSESLAKIQVYKKNKKKVILLQKKIVFPFLLVVTVKLDNL